MTATSAALLSAAFSCRKPVKTAAGQDSTTRKQVCCSLFLRRLSCTRKPPRRPKPPSLLSPSPPRCARRHRPPPLPDSATAGIFPLDQVHRGQHGVAYTVFEGVALRRRGGNPGRPAQRPGAEAGHDPRSPWRQGRHLYRRRRRHERQPGLHRRQTCRRARLPHRPVQQGAHRRHHPHPADAAGERHAAGRRPARSAPAMPRSVPSRHRCSSAASASRRSMHSKTASPPRD